jgi:thiamine-phosphate diphosphorylase
MLITGSDPTQPKDFLAKLHQALVSGVQLVQLRAPDLIATEYWKLAILVQNLCAEFTVQLMLNPPTNAIKFMSDTGLHLTSHNLMLLTKRPENWQMVGASCHTRTELIHAANLELDYAVLSPVLVTTTHPQAKPLGWNKFAKLVAEVKIPVYALGGMTVEHIVLAKENGACGIAAIRGLWRTD